MPAKLAREDAKRRGNQFEKLILGLGGGLGSGHANYATLLMKDRELPAK